MKKLLALTGLFVLSHVALADTCRTEMVDYQGNVRLIIVQAQPNYADPYCYWGYQQCLASLHLNPTMRPSCRVMAIVQQPTYNPTPQPTTPQPRPGTPRPQWNPGDDGRTNPNQPPRPGSSSGRVQPQPRLEVDMSGLLSADDFDGQRAVEMGETVYMYGKSYIVVSANGNDIDIQPEGSRNKRDIVRVSRDKIAIARGCTLNVCVTDPIFNLSKGTSEAVAGITTTGELVTKSSDSGKINPQAVKLKDVALAKGCVTNRSRQEICVGNTIQVRDGRYFEVVAVQHDQKLVVKTEGRNPSAFRDVDPSDLLVVR